MCNRFRQLRTKENLSLLFKARPLADRPEPAQDIFPNYQAAIVRREAGERIIDVLPWGVPLSMKGVRGPVLKRITNVRNLESSFWKSALNRPEWRCLVPFTSFAEPKSGKDEDGKPANWWFNLPSAEVAAFAGIWRPYGLKHKDQELSGAAFAFLTCEPNPLVAPLHPKAMPVILQPEDYDRWLDGTYADACSLAQPFPSQLMAVV